MNETRNYHFFHSVMAHDLYEIRYPETDSSEADYPEVDYSDADCPVE